MDEEYTSQSYYPILSFNTSNNFTDIPIPTNHEWQSVTQKYFPSRCQGQYKKMNNPIKWDKKTATTWPITIAVTEEIQANLAPTNAISTSYEAVPNKSQP